MTRRSAKRMQSMAKMTTIRVSSNSIFDRKVLLRLASIINALSPILSFGLSITPDFTNFTFHKWITFLQGLAMIGYWQDYRPIICHNLLMTEIRFEHSQSKKILTTPVVHIH